MANKEGDVVLVNIEGLLVVGTITDLITGSSYSTIYRVRTSFDNAHVLVSSVDFRAPTPFEIELLCLR